MGRSYNRARVAGFKAWARKAAKEGTISKRERRQVLRACRWNPEAVDEELEDQMEEASERGLYGSGEEPGPEAGETDWEAFFDGLANFAKEVLPLVLTICAA